MATSGNISSADLDSRLISAASDSDRGGVAFVPIAADPPGADAPPGHTGTTSAEPCEQRLARHPLKLPPGSVRALLTLIIVSFVVIQTARGIPVDVVWSEALMIMLAHYFTTRRFVPLSRELRAKLEAAGAIEIDANPLYLPSHSVRVLIIAAFVGLGVYLHNCGRLFETQSLSLLVSVGAYLLGIVAKEFLAWWARVTGAVAPGWWIDLKAAATLLVVLLAVGLQFFAAEQSLPVDVSRLKDFSLGLVLFYFGSR
jgi:hypothetical protein